MLVSCVVEMEVWTVCCVLCSAVCMRMYARACTLIALVRFALAWAAGQLADLCRVLCVLCAVTYFNRVA